MLAAYSAVDPEGDWSPDWAEVWLETGAGQPLPAETRRHARPDGRVSDRADLAARRQETDQRLLANLLRVNTARVASHGSNA